MSTVQIMNVEDEQTPICMWGGRIGERGDNPHRSVTLCNPTQIPDPSVRMTTTNQFVTCVHCRTILGSVPPMPKCEEVVEQLKIGIATNESWPCQTEPPRTLLIADETPEVTEEVRLANNLQRFVQSVPFLRPYDTTCHVKLGKDTSDIANEQQLPYPDTIERDCKKILDIKPTTFDYLGMMIDEYIVPNWEGKKSKLIWVLSGFISKTIDDKGEKVPVTHCDFTPSESGRHKEWARRRVAQLFHKYYKATHLNNIEFSYTPLKQFENK